MPLRPRTARRAVSTGPTEACPRIGTNRTRRQGGQSSAPRARRASPATPRRGPGGRSRTPRLGNASVSRSCSSAAAEAPSVEACTDASGGRGARRVDAGDVDDRPVRKRPAPVTTAPPTGSTPWRRKLAERLRTGGSQDRPGHAADRVARRRQQVAAPGVDDRLDIALIEQITLDDGHRCHGADGTERASQDRDRSVAIRQPAPSTAVPRRPPQLPCERRTDDCRYHVARRSRSSLARPALRART